jgi:V/A-type H+/Na+-transporting ATPase subunit I
MPLRDALETTEMSRVAVVAPSAQLRNVLAILSEAGVVELERLNDPVSSPAGAALEQTRRELGTTSRPGHCVPATSDSPDAASVEDAVELAERLRDTALKEIESSAIRHKDVSALVGWSPTASTAGLSERLAQFGGAVVILRRPRGVDPPTLVDGRGVTGAFQPLVDTYATVPYADLNPSALAGVAYVVMFGMMFGDVGHGGLLVLAGLLLRFRCPKTLVRVRHLAPFVIGAGLASVAFGFAYGELFGPTHVTPTLWLSPLDHATTLLAVAVAAGAGLIAVAYGLGTVNRWREGGAASALVATSGGAGVILYAGIGVVGLGWYKHVPEVLVGGALLAVAGLILGFIGCYSETTRGIGGAGEAGIELFDAVLRIGTNTVSFARLAAFGLTHAALGGIVWSATDGLAHRGPALWLAAGAVFLLGNAVTFALEGLVAGIQALRLEYYELFSRIFVAEGHPFRPWQLPPMSTKETSCSPG